MSDVIFNVADKNPYDCLYYDTTYGYRACVNGKRMTITSSDTVKALRNEFGLPELNIKVDDLARFEDCLYGEK